MKAPEGIITMFPVNVLAATSNIFQTKPLRTSVFQSQAVNTGNDTQSQALKNSIFGLPTPNFNISGGSTASETPQSKAAPPSNMLGLPSSSTSIIGTATPSNIFQTQLPTYKRRRLPYSIAYTTSSIFQTQSVPTKSNLQTQPTTITNIFKAQATSTSIFDTAVDSRPPASLPHQRISRTRPANLIESTTLSLKHERRYREKGVDVDDQGEEEVTKVGKSRAQEEEEE